MEDILFVPNTAPRIEPTYVHQDRELGPHDHALVPPSLADVDEDRARLLQHRSTFKLSEHMEQVRREESERIAPEVVPVEIGDKISFDDEEGKPVTATVEDIHQGVPVLSEPEPDAHEIVNEG